MAIPRKRKASKRLNAARQRTGRRDACANSVLFTVCLSSRGESSFGLEVDVGHFQSAQAVGHRPLEFIANSVAEHGGDALLAEHATAIFGPVREELKTRIMVSMPSEAAEDPEHICELLAHGMNIMRVNCAHDGPDA
jgi:hypothetical protein